MFDKLSKLIGFTKTETKIVLFIILTFIIGFSYKNFFVVDKQKDYQIIPYNEKTGLFNQYESKGKSQDSIKSTNKKVDYKQEVLDFNTQSFNNVQKKIVPAEKSINLNSAKVSDLTALPGIGEKTANKIIEYRNEIKKFKNINELLNVKGIGESKLRKIKKYIFID